MLRNFPSTRTLSEASSLKISKCAKMVPKLLSEDQKQQRVTVSQDIIEYLEDDPDLLGRVITGGESWIFEYDPETKRQSRQWKSPASPRPRKARMSKSKVMVMLIAFFNINGIVHFKFLPQGQTVNQYVYKEILRRLVRSVRDKRRDLWENNTWVLHHDNTPAHSAPEHPTVSGGEERANSGATPVFARVGPL